MDYQVAVDAIAFAREHDGFHIDIGGGEPTLHPRFFDILRHCLNDFSNVWLATNGSQTDTMFRLSNIIDGDDYPENVDPEDEIEYERACQQCINAGDALYVSLSRDRYHSAIDERIVRIWTEGEARKDGHYEIRNFERYGRTADMIGRAKRNGIGAPRDRCGCEGVIIKPSGILRMCGCRNSPVIGHVSTGIEERWVDLIESDEYRDWQCYQKVKGLVRKVRKGTFELPMDKLWTAPLGGDENERASA